MLIRNIMWLRPCLEYRTNLGITVAVYIKMWKRSQKRLSSNLNIMTDCAVSRKRIGKQVPKLSWISSHCYATVLVLVLWFNASSVTLTVESQYPRQRTVDNTAKEGRRKIYCWERCRIFGRLKDCVKRQKSEEVNPCGGGVEYLHRDPASRRRRRKGMSQIWESKIWSQVPKDLDPRKTALAKASSTYKRQTRPLVRVGAPQEQDRNCHTSNKDLVVSPRWVLYSKTDWPADRLS
jgi:hypothetical protein